MKDYAFDLMDALQAPMITFNQSWADTIPKRILDIIPMARMIALSKCEQQATYPECVAYLYTRSLEAPMDHDWTEIYTHVSCVTLENWFGENHFEQVQAPRQLNDWLLSQLTDLRNHIYSKRRQVLKDRLKGKRK